ncbi:hypothetical protein ACFOY5_04490 [Massilia aurea]|jgi:hypothetical protein|uniref:hypothetical protein n=1 Tax=Massilia aurea TaxID=373040 RepID=UPI0021637739|nr:hypothetical protein [Massilia aurea]MCS0707456.1 hypothetical protein [Massilia aurea]
MRNEIYDELDELPAALRVDIPAADLALLERAARAIGAVRVEVIDGEGYVNLHFDDGSVLHSWNPLVFSGDALDLAVDLGLRIEPLKNTVSGRACSAIATRDARADVRHAITQAAAEL